jgi:hypothetical protein
MASGDPLYGAFCILAVAIVTVPAIVAGTARTFVPLSLQLFCLWVLVADMTFGNLLGFYQTIPWFDKVLHFGNSALIGMTAFLAVYVAHLLGRNRRHLWVDGIAIFLITLGLGAMWEIGEYLVDHYLGYHSQGSPGSPPLDDTMIDLMLDGIGGLVAAIFGPMYIRHSARSQAQVAELAALLAERPARAQRRHLARILKKVRS